MIPCIAVYMTAISQRSFSKSNNNSVRFTDLKFEK